MTHQFRGLIKCLNCGKNFKAKMERKKHIYLCSGYANYGASFCPRFQLEEEDIIYTVSKHLAIMGQRVVGSMGELIHVIEVKGKGYTVHYKDGTKSIINGDNELGIVLKY